MPENLTTIGVGYIGLELASMSAKYGNEVTVLDRSRESLSREDADISQLVKKDLEDAGVHSELGADIKEIINEENEAKVRYQINGQEEEISTNRTLAATGRKPNIESLDLRNTSIEVTDHGAVKVDDFLRATVGKVRVIGDVEGGLQFTCISLGDFRIIKD